MKTTSKLFLFVTVISVGIVSCKKDNITKAPVSPVYPIPVTNDAAMKAFFSSYNIAPQNYNVNASTGGSFTSSQGTTVTIPANIFLTQANVPVTGDVTIQFIDVYKKSDIFLASMLTQSSNGAPLKSGGEFFIKAIQNNEALILAPGKKIDVQQPASLTSGITTASAPQAFTWKDSLIYPTNCTICPDYIINDPLWSLINVDNVQTTTQNYIFSLNQFNSPVDAGSWCISGDAVFFNSYPKTTLNIIAQDSVSTYSTQVFLVFKNQTSVVQVGPTGYENYQYSYAPQDLQCTIVALGFKNGNIYSSFTPITIGRTQTVSFTLSQTTTSAFVAQLKTLD
jgi:hypothetical protein